MADSINHKVIEGETLTSISLKYGVSIDDILKLNPDITDRNVIRTNQIIIIPNQPNSNNKLNQLVQTGSNSKSSSASTTTGSDVVNCPLMNQSDNWVEIKYLYYLGGGVPGAVCVILDPLTNQEITRGVLDSNGNFLSSIPQNYSSVSYYFDNDPEIYKISSDFTPNIVTPNSSYYDKIDALIDTLKTVPNFLWTDIKSAGKWSWEVIQGDFNENPSMSQIVATTIISVIPVVDQISDLRDLVANIKKLTWDKRYDDYWVWVSLILTLIGCIPALGSVLKGIAKLIIVKGLKNLPDLAEILRFLNFMGKGNGVQFLKDLLPKFKAMSSDIHQQISLLLNKLSDKVKVIKEKIPGSKSISELLESLENAKKYLNNHNPVDIFFKDLSDKIDTILSGGKRKVYNSPTKVTSKVSQEAKFPGSESATKSNTGMSNAHRQRAVAVASHRKQIIIFRCTNPDAMRWQNVPKYLPKPHEVLLKSRKAGNFAGLVEKPKKLTDSQKAILKKYEDSLNLKPPVPPSDLTPSQLAEAKGLKLQEDNVKDLMSKGYRFDNDGLLVDPQGNRFYSDYDLQGVYKVDESGNVISGSDNTNLPIRQHQLNNDLSIENELMVQHGSNDSYRVIDPYTGEEVIGRVPGVNEDYYVIEPNGNEFVIKGTPNLKKYYESKGIPWPYPDNL